MTCRGPLPNFFRQLFVFAKNDQNSQSSSLWHSICWEKKNLVNCSSLILSSIVVWCFACLTVLGRINLNGIFNIVVSANYDAVFITVIPALRESTYSHHFIIEGLDIAGIQGEQKAILAWWDIFESSAIGLPTTKCLEMMVKSESVVQ